MLKGSFWVLVADFWLILAVVALSMMGNVNAQPTKAAPNNEAAIVRMWWGPDGNDNDVDLWVKAPGDDPVGYNRKQGKTFSLLRDDLGKSGMDGDSHNEEEQEAFKGLVPGEYVINVMWFRKRDQTSTINVDIELTIRRPDGTYEKIDLGQYAHANLYQEGEEHTMVRFTIEPDGSVDNLNRIPLGMRTDRAT